MPRPPSPIEIDPVALTVLREKDGHSKSSLAAKANMSLGYLSDLESGRRKGNPEVIGKLADALNVPRSLLEKKRDGEQVPA
jgi:transcriptional regulator with XRE-family HTH domain